jgi:multiple sugar transport system substrate-binding protein
MKTHPDERTMNRPWLVVVTFAIVTAVGVGGALAAPQGLRVLTRDTSAIGGPAIVHGRTFTDRTGIGVSVTQIPFALLYDRIMLGLVTGRLDFDALLIPSDWLPDFAPYLAPVPPRIIESPAVKDILPIYRNALMRWQDRTCPMGGSCGPPRWVKLLL